MDFGRFIFTRGKYVSDIYEWEEAHNYELSNLFRIFNQYALVHKVCDQVDYVDFVELLYKYSEKVVYFENEENDLNDI